MSSPTRRPTPPLPPEELELLGRLRCGDDDAFEALVRAHTGRMLATARRLVRNEEDARDVVQEAFAAAWKALPAFAGQSRLGTWLHRITVNAALMKLRSQRRRPELFLEELAPGLDDEPRTATAHEPAFAPPDAGVRHRELARVLHDALARLPEDYRTAIELRDLEERDTEETARLLGTTPGAVKTRLHRARQALRALLEPELAEALG